MKIDEIDCSFSLKFDDRTGNYSFSSALLDATGVGRTAKSAVEDYVENLKARAEILLLLAKEFNDEKDQLFTPGPC